MPTVTKLPLKTSIPTSSKEHVEKLRVAAYARVSTDREEQSNSYEAQCDYFTNKILNNPNWEFAGMYADEGITGTSTKHRDGFNQMVEDALAGKIDRIITKSVSRFARNTVDSLTTIRQLKENGIGVYFEKENIDSLDSKGELMLTIMSSLAQEESRSISENTTWGIRKKFADGKHSMAYSTFLGYDKGPDGKMVINPEQAEIVKFIYSMYLQGNMATAIADKLTEIGIKTASGGDKWHYSTIMRILTNEKYKGDVLLQKTYSENFLTKKTIKNDGRVQQYYIENDHEAIISPEIFDLVQSIIERRKKARSPGADSGHLQYKIKCGECGGWFGPKVFHSNDKYRMLKYRCNEKYKVRGRVKCHTGLLDENQINEAFVAAISKTFSQQNELKDNIDAILGELDNCYQDTSIVENIRSELGKTFNKTLFMTLVDYMEVNPDETITVIFRNGSECEVPIKPYIPRKRYSLK